MSQDQYLKARTYLAFKFLLADKNKPPEPSECALYEMCFAFQNEHPEFRGR